MTLFSNSSTPMLAAFNVRLCVYTAIFAATLLTSACARFIPADPYKDTQTVKVLEVPEGKVRPAVDPSLAVPEGKTAWTDNGHTPPAVTKPEPEKSAAAPEIVEETGDDK